MSLVDESSNVTEFRGETTIQSSDFTSCCARAYEASNHICSDTNNHYHLQTMCQCYKYYRKGKPVVLDPLNEARSVFPILPFVIRNHLSSSSPDMLQFACLSCGRHFCLYYPFCLSDSVHDSFASRLWISQWSPIFLSTPLSIFS